MVSITIQRDLVAVGVCERKRFFLAGEKDDHKPYCEGEKQILHVVKCLEDLDKSVIALSTLLHGRKGKWVAHDPK
jgi:hypothetical protein